MKIKDVEKRVGITSANVRFYEKEGLLNPVRNQENNYREYTEADVEILKQIKVLRLLGIPLADIKRLNKGEISLEVIVENRLEQIHQEEKNLQAVEKVCETILRSDMGVEMLDETILSEDKHVWKERLEEVMQRDISKEKVNRKQLNRTMALMLGWGYFLNAIVACFVSRYFLIENDFSYVRNLYLPDHLLVLIVVAIVCGIMVWWTTNVKAQTLVFHINAMLLTPTVLAIAGPMLRNQDGTLKIAGNPNVIFAVYWLMVVGFVFAMWFLSEKWGGMFQRVRSTLGIVLVYGSIMTAVGYMMCGNLALSAVASFLITLYIGMNWTTTVMDGETYNRYYAVVAASRMMNVIAMFLHMKGRTYSFGRWKDHE